MRRRFFLALTVISLCPACASMATQGGYASRSVATMGAHAVATDRRTFNSRLSAIDERPGAAPVAAGSLARGTVRLVVKDDDTFEYLATIYNPRGETFTAAFLRRGEASAGGTIVATLFSDLTLRSRYIQLRGTVSVSRDMRSALLAEELRERPRSFSLSVHSAESSRIGAIRGVIE